VEGHPEHQWRANRGNQEQFQRVPAPDVFFGQQPKKQERQRVGNQMRKSRVHQPEPENVLRRKPGTESQPRYFFDRNEQFAVRKKKKRGYQQKR